MEQSISVVLPVHNAEATLARSVADVLDVLPDLTNRFEVLIVDDGSTDLTAESADELARRFPQLKVVRHATQQGIPAVVKTGLRQAYGDLVVVQDPSNPLRRRDLMQIQAFRTPTRKGQESSKTDRQTNRLMLLGTGFSQ